MQTKGTTCLTTISSHVLITVFQSIQMGVPFSFNGSNGILGLCIVYRQENGGFCLPCVLFATSGYRGSDPGVLVSHPLTTFGKALESLHKHADKGHHKTAVIRSEEFLKTMTHQQPDIQCRLNQAMASRIS